MILERDEGGTDKWGMAAELLPDEIYSDPHLGSSVDIDGDVVVAGAPFDTSSGRAYIFERDSNTDEWSEVAKLEAENQSFSARFGDAVAISGDIVAVGASGDSTVTIFERDFGGSDNWGEILTIDDPDSSDGFGDPLSLLDERLLVGAHDATVDGNASGAAYRFEQDEGGAYNWGLNQVLAPDDAESGDQFGTAVAMDDHLALVGATAGSSEGKAHVFGDESDKEGKPLLAVVVPHQISIDVMLRTVRHIGETGDKDIIVVLLNGVDADEATLHRFQKLLFAKIDGHSFEVVAEDSKQNIVHLAGGREIIAVSTDIRFCLSSSLGLMTALVCCTSRTSAPEKISAIRNFYRKLPGSSRCRCPSNDGGLQKMCNKIRICSSSVVSTTRACVLSVRRGERRRTSSVCISRHCDRDCSSSPAVAIDRSGLTVIDQHYDARARAFIFGE